MEFNEEFNVLFEISVLPQLFYAYKFDFPYHELVDAVYSNVRTFNPELDRVDFSYCCKSDYSGLVKYLRSKLN